MSDHTRGVSVRQRRMLILAALIPAAADLLKAPLGTAGRGAWLCPLLALPGGLLTCWGWRRFRPGERGRLLSALYLAWGVILLWGSAPRTVRRLLASVAPEGREVAVLCTLLAAVLYLARRREVLARSGPILFGGAVAALLLALVLALPALRVENLAPLTGTELRGLLPGAGWVLSLAGYGVYGTFLPAEEQKGSAGWCLWGCMGATLLLGTVVGAFGPALALRMDHPFLYLLREAGLPGAFQRGEALLSAMTALGDLALLGLLAQVCGQLWKELFGGWAWLPAGAGFALAAVAPGIGEALLSGPAGLAGGLALGVAAPLLASLVRSPGRGKGSPTFCGQKTKEKADVGANLTGKKSLKENEKKC